MVTIEYIRKAAESCDTDMARAFRKALGLPVLWADAPIERIVSAERADEIDWCFRNFGSPMDW